MNDYEILGISKNSSLEEVKKRYRILIKKYHPDKNNNINKDKFIEIHEAYKNILKKKTGNGYINILSDLYNEGIFDKYINLIYNNYVYNFTEKNKVIVLDCSLEELYISCIKTIKYKRIVAISPINFITEEKEIKLNINSKNYNNQNIIFKNFGDKYEFNTKPNNLIIKIKEMEHEIFKKEDFNLILNLNLSLKEALTCSTIIKIPLLDGKYYDYKIDKIISPNFKDIVKNYGFKKDDDKYGDLKINFNITFPKSLTNEQISKLNDILN